MSGELFSGAIKLLLGDSSEDTSLVDPDDLPPQDTAIMTDPPVRTFLAFGEPVVSYEQVGESYEDADIVVRRRIVCPELELARALAVLGDYCEYFTVIPAGYYGDLVQTVTAQAGVHIYAMQGEEGSHIGDLTNMNGRKVNQRLLSAFHCAQSPFKWQRGIVSDRVPCWVHTCMSSFVWSDCALNSWTAFMQSATDPKRTTKGDVLISLELRSRDCQVLLSELWAFLGDYMRKIFLVILSPEEAVGIAELLGLSASGLQGKQLDGYEPAWNVFANQLRGKLGSFSVVIPFESDDASCRVVVAAGGSASASQRVVCSSMTLVAKIVHSLMHAFPKQPLDIEKLVASVASRTPQVSSVQMAQLQRGESLDAIDEDNTWERGGSVDQSDDDNT